MQHKNRSCAYCKNKFFEEMWVSGFFLTLSGKTPFWLVNRQEEDFGLFESENHANTIYAML